MTAVGLLTNAMKRDVTFVMKSHIALARARVPLGSAGAQLDAIAREPLWKAGLNFGHGTGHGVGFMLSVHEGPFTISPRALKTGELGAQPGIVISDEPGVYRPGKWGVRIENLLALKKAESTEFDDFLDFSVLTLCPIDPATLDAVLLDAGEKAWLRAYHEALRQKLSGRLSDRAAKWLDVVCENYKEM
jgi:Xaa-Pro aminopeptidase